MGGNRTCNRRIGDSSPGRRCRCLREPRRGRRSRWPRTPGTSATLRRWPFPTRAAGLLAKFRRDRFSRPEDAGSDGDVAWQQPEAKEAHAVKGEERTDRSPEREDELRVQRTEEELKAGTREREAGEVRLRKDVRTDREAVEVPTRREEIHVDRVPLAGEAATEARIGDEEVSVTVTEEEAWWSSGRSSRKS